MALVDLENGKLIDPAGLNANFHYLDDAITAAITQITGGSSTTIASISSTMATIESNVSNGGIVPAGTIIWFAGATAPTGYVICNGGHYPISGEGAKASLFAVIGYTYGRVGDDFCVPNMTDNRFVRGGTSVGATEDYSSATPIDRNVYVETNSAGTHAHNHVLSSITASYSEPAGDHGHSFTVYYKDTTLSTPRNITLLPCIKY